MKAYLLIACLCTSIASWATGVSRGEYFIDADPGYGLATAISGEMSDTLNFTADASGLDQGIHSLFARVQDSSGAWSQTVRYPFVVVKDMPLDQTKIVYAEYFVDADPGAGNATGVEISGEGDDVTVQFTAQVNGIDIGMHILYVRVRDAQGNWSIIRGTEFCYGAAAVFSVSDSVVCQSGIIQFSNETQGTSSTTSFSWDLDGNSVEDKNTDGSFQYNYDTPGTYFASLTVSENGQCSNTFTKKIVIAEPLVSIQTTTEEPIYANTDVALTVDVSGTTDHYTLEWLSDDIDIENNASDTIHISPETPGTYKIVANVSDLGGCVASDTFNLQVLSLSSDFIVADTIIVYQGAEPLPIETQNVNGETPVWASKDTTIAKVDELGYVTFAGAGIATIIGQLGDSFKDSVIIDARGGYVPVEELVMLKYSSVSVEQTLEIATVIKPENASVQTLRWKSSDESIATVDQNGKVKGISAGTCNIAAITDDGNILAVTVLAVNESGATIPVDSVVVADTVYMSVNSKFAINADIVPFYANSGTSLTWESAEQDIASVSASGVVTGKKVGKTSITVTPAIGTGSRTIIIVGGSELPEITLPNSLSFLQAHDQWKIELNNYITDDNTNADAIQWAISKTDHIFGTVGEENILLLSSTDASWTGSEVLTFTAIDTDGLKISKQVEIVVSDAEDAAPGLFFAPVRQKIASVFTLKLANYISDDLDDFSSLKITATVIGTATANIADGILTVTPASEDWTGTDTVRIVAKDSYGNENTQNMVYSVDPNYEGLFAIGSVPQQFSNSLGQFAGLPLHRYISGGILPDLITWTASASYRLYLKIDGDILVAEAMDENWAGTETVRLYAQSADGQKDSVDVFYTQLKPVDVKWQGSPEISFFADKKRVAKNSTVKLFPTITGAETWKWIVKGNGDEQTSEELQPEFAFATSGLYSVSLITQTISQFDTLTAKDYIMVTGIDVSDDTVCAGQSVTLSIDATGLESWKWSNGEITDKITIAPTESGYVGIELSYGLSTFKDSVHLTVAQSFEFESDSEQFCYGDSLKIDRDGTFSWSNGSETPGIAITDVGKISVTVTDVFGCLWKDTLTVTDVFALPTIEMNTDTALCPGASLSLAVGNFSNYSWSNGSDLAEIEISEPGVYTVTVENSNGCTAHHSTTVSEYSIHIEPLQLCTYNSKSTAVTIVWNHTENTRTNKYELYREDKASVWTLIHTVAKGDSTYYVDKDANAVRQTYKYKLRTIDSVCPSAVAESEPHKTMHFTVTPGTSKNIVNLEWNSYIGKSPVEIGTYYIYEITEAGSMQIGSVPADDQDYYSFSFDQYNKDAKYRVLFNLPQEVSATKLKNESGPFSQSMSNLSEAIVEDNIFQNAMNQISISPSPTTEKAIVSYKPFSGFGTLTLFDLSGSIVRTLTVNGSGNAVLDVQALSCGTYIVQLECFGTIYVESFTKK